MPAELKNILDAKALLKLNRFASDDIKQYLEGNKVNIDYLQKVYAEAAKAVNSQKAKDIATHMAILIFRYGAPLSRVRIDLRDEGAGVIEILSPEGINIENLKAGKEQDMLLLAAPAAASSSFVVFKDSSNLSVESTSSSLMEREAIISEMAKVIEKGGRLGEFAGYKDKVNNPDYTLIPERYYYATDFQAVAGILAKKKIEPEKSFTGEVGVFVNQAFSILGQHSSILNWQSRSASFWPEFTSEGMVKAAGDKDAALEFTLKNEQAKTIRSIDHSRSNRRLGFIESIDLNNIKHLRLIVLGDEKRASEARSALKNKGIDIEVVSANELEKEIRFQQRATQEAIFSSFFKEILGPDGGSAGSTAYEPDPQRAALLIEDILKRVNGGRPKEETRPSEDEMRREQIYEILHGRFIENTYNKDGVFYLDKQLTNADIARGAQEAVSIINIFVGPLSLFQDYSHDPDIAKDLENVKNSLIAEIQRLNGANRDSGPATAGSSLTDKQGEGKEAAPGFVKIASVGDKITVGTMKCSQEFIFQAKDMTAEQLAKAVDYNGEYITQFFSAFANSDTADSVAKLKKIRPLLRFIIDNYWRLPREAAKETKREEIQRLYKKIENYIPPDAAYRKKLVKDIETALQGLGGPALNDMLLRITIEVISSLRFTRLFSGTMASAIAPFTIKFVLNSPSPVIINRSNKNIELDIFAFLSRTGSSFAGKRLLNLELRRAVSINAALNDILSETNVEVPREILSDMLSILIEDKDINARWTYGNRKKLKRYEQTGYVNELRFYGANHYASLIRRLSNEDRLDEKIKLIYSYLDEEFGLAKKYGLTDRSALLEKVSQFISSNFDKFESRELRYYVGHLYSSFPKTKESSGKPGQGSAGPAVVEKSEREIEHLKIREENASSEEKVADYVFAYSQDEEKQRPSQTSSRVSSGQRETRESAPVVYKTPNRSQQDYITKIADALSLFDSAKNTKERLELFLGKLFPHYLVARADHADDVTDGNKDNELRIKVREGLNMAMLGIKDDYGFSADIQALMQARDQREIRKIAARLRNNPLLLKENIYFHVELAGALEGSNTRVDVLYALAYAVDFEKILKVYNRQESLGDDIALYHLGERLDSLDKEMAAFGFMYRGDTHGAVIIGAVKQYVLRKMLPILLDKPYLLVSGSKMHPLSTTISRAVKAVFGRSSAGEIDEKIYAIVRTHEAQHIVDDLLGRIDNSADAETSAYLAEMGRGGIPLISLIQIIELYLDPYAPIFAPAYYQSAVKIVEELVRRLKVEKVNNNKDQADAVLKKALQLGSDKLSLLAQEMHRDWFGPGALIAFRPEQMPAKLPAAVKKIEEEVVKEKSAEQPAAISFIESWQRISGDRGQSVFSSSQKLFLGIITAAIFSYFLLFDYQYETQKSPGESEYRLRIPADPKSPGADLGLLGASLGLHMVSSGETLSGIAAEYYGNSSLYISEYLADTNGILNPGTIKKGAILRLPDKIIHVVRQGESLGSIANQYWVTIERLIAMNAGLAKGGHLIYPGDKITVAEKNSAGSSLGQGSEFKFDDLWKAEGLSEAEADLRANGLNNFEDISSQLPESISHMKLYRYKKNPQLTFFKKDVPRGKIGILNDFLRDRQPAIVPTIPVSDENGAAYYELNLAPFGYQTLANFVKNKIWAITPELAKPVRIAVQQAFRARARWFEHGHLHPQNILVKVDSAGRILDVKLIDWDELKMLPQERQLVNYDELSGKSLEWAILDGVDLRGRSFKDTILPFASLRGADLRGADFTGIAKGLVLTDFTEADLRGAKYDALQFRYCWLDKTMVDVDKE